MGFRGMVAELKKAFCNKIFYAVILVGCFAAVMAFFNSTAWGISKFWMRYMAGDADTIASALKFNYTYNPEAAATVDVQGANTTATMATNNNAAGDNQQGNAAGRMADNNPGDGNTQEDLEQLGDEAVPRGLRNTDAWAFANLILAVVTFLATIIPWIAYYIKKKKIEKSHEQEEIGTTEESNFYKSFRIFSIVVGAASVVFFFLTEDVTLPIRMTDQYTWIMTVAFFVQLIDMLYIWTKGKGHKEKE